MTAIASLYKSQGPKQGLNHQELANLMGLNLTPEEKARAEKQEAKKKEKEKAKEEKVKKEENKHKKKRVPFNFETVCEDPRSIPW